MTRNLRVNQIWPVGVLQLSGTYGDVSIRIRLRGCGQFLRGIKDIKFLNIKSVFILLVFYGKVDKIEISTYLAVDVFN